MIQNDVKTEWKQFKNGPKSIPKLFESGALLKVMALFLIVGESLSCNLGNTIEHS